MKYNVYKGSMAHFDNSHGKLIACGIEKEGLFEIVKKHTLEQYHNSEDSICFCIRNLLLGALMESEEHNFNLWLKEAA
jgi:hypothetical protein